MSRLKFLLATGATAILVAIFYCMFRDGSSEEVLLTEDDNSLIFPTKDVHLISTTAEVNKAGFDNVRNFIFFVGYSRSGSTIVGSMMDAHPSVIIANENKYLLQWWKNPAPGPTLDRDSLFSLLCADSERSATNGGRAPNHVLRKGYSIGVKSQWQGKFSDLRLIGNKRAEKLTNLFLNDPVGMKSKYDQLIETLKVPIIAIHVIRNPFDMVATRMYYANRTAYPHKLLEKNVVKLHDDKLMKSEVQHVFALAETVLKMENEFKFNIIHIHIEDFVRNPNSTIKSMCKYLRIPCPEWYVRSCADSVFPEVSKTRTLVEWTQESLDFMQEKMKQFPFFVGYTYNDNFYKYR